MNASINAYRKVQVTTANPLQLVIQLYDGAIRFTERGLAGIQASNPAAAHDGFIRAQAIVTELRVTLNPDTGEVARVLSQVYDLIHRQLVAANLRKDPVPARLALRSLQELLDAWHQVAASGASPADVAAGEPTLVGAAK